MSKPRYTGVLLAGLLLTASVPHAGAAPLSTAIAKSIQEHIRSASAAQTEETAPARQTGRQVGFAGLEKTVREKNPTVKALDRTLAGIKGTDLDAQFAGQYLQYEAQRTAYQRQIEAYQQAIAALEQHAADPAIAAQIAALRINLGVAQGSLEGANRAIDALDKAEENARDDLADTVATYERQFENAKNQLVLGAQSAYLGAVSIRAGLDTLDRSLAGLDRNLAVVEKQVSLGMASQLTLDSLRQTRGTVLAQRATLEKQLDGVQNQLALLLGEPAGEAVTVADAPEVSERQLSEMRYETDLEQVKKNSYAIWSKQDAARKASNDYEDNVTATVDAYEAAKLNLEAEKENVTVAFRALYQDVQDKRAQATDAQAALALQQRNFAVSELQYNRRMISKNDFLGAQDELAAKQDALDAAKLALFTAYNTYDWARRGLMNSASS